MSSPIDRRRFAIPALLAFATIAPSSLGPREVHGAVSPRDRRLTNLAVGISVEAPAGWTLSQHTGYRDTVVLLLHPDGSRISVNAAATPTRTAAELFRENLRGLNASGLRVLSSAAGARGALVVDLGAAANGGERLRQHYLVREIPGGWQAIVLTLVCRDAVFASRAPALDFVLTRMALDEPTPPAGDSRSSGGLPGAGGSGARPPATDSNRNAAAQQPDKR
jgi:hypothetical protein